MGRQADEIIAKTSGFSCSLGSEDNKYARDYINNLIQATKEYFEALDSATLT